jgi:hypothetical protein
MTDPFAWWLLILGVGIGVGLLWLVIGRVPREEDDVAAEERVAEAAWISRVIGRYGGVAPAALVEEVLELHEQYLKGAASEQGPIDEVEPVGPEDETRSAQLSRQAEGPEADRSTPSKPVHGSTSKPPPARTAGQT